MAKRKRCEYCPDQKHPRLARIAVYPGSSIKVYICSPCLESAKKRQAILDAGGSVSGPIIPGLRF
jgi:hypothetical protein